MHEGAIGQGMGRGEKARRRKGVRFGGSHLVKEAEGRGAKDARTRSRRTRVRVGRRERRVWLLCGRGRKPVLQRGRRIAIFTRREDKLVIKNSGAR